MAEPAHSTNRASSSIPAEPAYLALLASGELARRVDARDELLGPVCRVCPIRCKADRRAGRIGRCLAGKDVAISSVCDHHGEEPPLSGTRGSGTVFAGHCNLHCLYCQNHQISQAARGAPIPEMDAEALAEGLLALQARGCHNINFVSPTHYVPQLVRALWLAARAGLRLPVVYNTNAYDSLEALRLLDGIIDIYLPDLKYADDEAGRQYSGVLGYVPAARAAIAEMWRQVGPLVVGPDGLARRGLIVRHLVLPNDLADSEASLRWLREELGPDVTLSLMGQYYPAHKAIGHPLLGRRASPREYARVIELAQRLGFHDLLIQDEQLAPEFYRPDFDHDHPFHRQNQP
jgi:putative pyruvate formate lyase activating enzyme